jgi:hypothetical protein
MRANKYESALQKARSELDHCLKLRGETDLKITRLKATIEALSALCDQQGLPVPLLLDDEFPKGFGITLTIRRCLSESKTPLSATQIRDALVKTGLDLSGYANKMSVIHNTLRRLQEQGEISIVRKPHGEVCGYFLNPVPSSPQEPGKIGFVTTGVNNVLSPKLTSPPGHIRTGQK